MPFLSPNEQYQITEAKNRTLEVHQILHTSKSY